METSQLMLYREYSKCYSLQSSNYKEHSVFCSNVRSQVFLLCITLLAKCSTPICLAPFLCTDSAVHCCHKNSPVQRKAVPVWGTTPDSLYMNSKEIRSSANYISYPCDNKHLICDQLTDTKSSLSEIISIDKSRPHCSMQLHSSRSVSSGSIN
jgi:hypothetical protein